ncbi:GATA transcription factor 26 [Platanthera zijinensis]|uniref:GATA transcription factor 26 n=1 Tax=Platanthera zijinensis TaxID=2320716 RepID=A0AAP0FVH2_9ASPA
MGKRGPCRHCGITSTPLWRNGPPEKPVLCNACGSRWKTKGSLANYTPLHAREPINWEMPEVARAKNTSNKLKEEKLKKRKLISVMVENDYEIQFSESGQNSIRNLDEDSSNRSSSGPAISYSESCAYFGNNETCDWTGSVQSNTRDSLVLSKKRSLIRSKPSSVEKLTKDLYSIWHEQQSSNLSGISDDDLLFESELIMGSDEIGHGGVLLGNPWPKVAEEESEASSLPSYDKDNFSPEILNILQERDPLLLSANLEDVASFEVFRKHMTNEEQQHLMKYLPSSDTTEPLSLKSMFSSPQFLECLSHFQQLLQEGIFDLSTLRMSVEECRTLKRLVLLNFIESRWVLHYKEIKDKKDRQVAAVKSSETSKSYFHYSILTPSKRHCESKDRHLLVSKVSARSPRRMQKSINASPPSKDSGPPSSGEAELEPDHAAEDFVDNDGSCFSPRSLFTLPPDDSSMLRLTGDSDSDPDLLLENYTWNHKMASNSSQPGSGVANEEGILSNFHAVRE